MENKGELNYIPGSAGSCLLDQGSCPPTKPAQTQQLLLSRQPPKAQRADGLGTTLLPSHIGSPPEILTPVSHPTPDPREASPGAHQAFSSWLLCL